MNDQASNTLRRRLKELLAIPQSQRTDAQWDEINELEISLAPVNREGAPPPGARRGPPPAERGKGGAPAAERGKGGGAPAAGRKPARKFPKRPPKDNPS